MTIEDICKYESICVQEKCNKDECDFFDIDKPEEYLGIGAPMIDPTEIRKVYKV